MRTGFLPMSGLLGWGLGGLAIASFHLAYYRDWLGWFIVAHLFCCLELTRLPTVRVAFYAGTGIGLAIFAPQLTFFWTIFHAAAIALWLILALWLGIFLMLGRLARERFAPSWFLILVPGLWTGLEYFRSELYYLKFSWLTVGNAVSTLLGSGASVLGVYGIGFAMMTAIALLMLAPTRLRFVGGAGVILLLGLAGFVQLTSPPTAGVSVKVAGVQMEFPGTPQVLAGLNRALQKSPGTVLFVLSEYTFDGPVPETILAWCRSHQKYLIAGGKDPVGDDYYNTAFVVGPDGRIVFKQAKSVPIQFFKDGLPAREQQVWNSPWGRIGICICYDLSYRGVVDPLVKQGAQALIVPTMDVAEWGDRQHRLHARIAPLRAAELGVPIFRVCSSGISQLVDAHGNVTATAPFPGEQAILAGELLLQQPGRVPVDHWLGLLSTGVTLCIVGILLTGSLRESFARRRGSAPDLEV